MILTIKRADEVKSGEYLATDERRGAFVYSTEPSGLGVVMQIEDHKPVLMPGSQLVGIWWNLDAN